MILRLGLWGPLLTGILVIGAAGCERTAPAPLDTTQIRVGDRTLVERGRAVYNFRCYFCHGYSGDSRTLAATYLAPPPRNFQSATTEMLPVDRIRAAVRDGRPGTAMHGFRQVIPESDIEAVSAFVFDEFVLKKQPNTRYHTVENGWPDHERYRPAYPFALGEIALTADPAQMSPQQQKGRTLYLESCISCHDRGKPVQDPVTWDSQALSFPRNNYDHKNPEVDAATSATPFRIHDVRPRLNTADASVLRGEKLFQDNCAFCHAADGTGKNWIGVFLVPKARDLTDPDFRARMTREQYRATIQKGLPGTSMPAWGDVLDTAQTSDLINYIEVAFGTP